VLYSGLLYLGVVAAVALSLGIATRVTSVVTFGVVAYNLFLSTTHLHNNRAFLVIVLAGLAVAPCGRELSVDAWWRRRRGWPPLDLRAPGWPLWLLRFEASVLYGASGLSKLLDADWFGGTVTWHRVTQHRSDLLASPLPGWAVDLLLDRGFHTVAAKVIVLTELAIATGLWSRRTRYAAVWLAVCFHVAIQLTASVEVFSYLAIAALVIWAVPSPRDRTLALDPARPAHRRLARTVRSLDWLARFRIVERAVESDAEPNGGGEPDGGGVQPHAEPDAQPVEGAEPDGGGVQPYAEPDAQPVEGGVRVTDHDGSVRVTDCDGSVGVTDCDGSVGVTDCDGSVVAGGPAVVLVLSRLPLTAWFALPTLLLPAVRRGRSRAASAPPRCRPRP
jgi:hypothetical protein